MMIKQSPYRNIFMFFRGASHDESKTNRQLEDNITKSLINLFEHSHKNLVRDFLSTYNILITTDHVIYDLQVSNTGSRPDALIRSFEYDIYIESKYESPFDDKQLQSHLKNFGGHLLYITKFKCSDEIIEKYQESKVVFLTWFDISNFLINIKCSKIYPSDTITYFLLNQFINYMEELNMSLFNGWTSRDFEAFLVVENESAKIAHDERKRVKDKLVQFIKEAKEQAAKSSALYSDSVFKIGNVDPEHVWGSIKFNPDTNLIDQIHISIIMLAYDFSVGIQIEGKNPTTKALKKIKNNKETFLEILKELKNFIFVIRDRYQIRVQNYESKVVAQLVIDEKTAIDDVDYIIKKIEQYNLIELRVVRVYQKHDVIKKGKEFIQECADSFIVLEKMLQFLK